MRKVESVVRQSGLTGGYFTGRAIGYK